MLIPLGLMFLLQAIFRPVLSCEADCEAGITAAFIENYSTHIQRVFLHLATEICETLSLNVEDPQRLVEPINNTYYATVQDSYTHEIFPSYFHGKCQNTTTGINPPGCPNPNCPVICGTPGSLVYYYDDLEAIVHNATKVNYKQAINPNSAAFSETLSRVLRAMDSDEKLGRPLRFPPARKYRSYRTHDRNSVIKILSSILRRFSKILDNQCGGNQKGQKSYLSACDWRQEMIPYILTFP